MAKKMKPGQKRCPSCKALVSGTRTKTCPKCGHEFNGKPQEPSKDGGTVTLEQVKKVAQTVKAMGGFQRMIEMLDVIKAVGGVKKFKELAEAMTAAEPDVVVF